MFLLLDRSRQVLERATCYIRAHSEQEERDFGFVITQVGKTAVKPGYRAGPVIRSEYFLFFITRGRGAIKSRSQVAEFSAGDVIVLYPQRCYEWWTDENDLFAKYWIGLRGRSADLLLGAWQRPAGPTVLHRDEVPQAELEALASMLEACGNKSTDDRYTLTKLNGITYQLIASLMETARDASASGVPAEDPVDLALRYIEQKYDQPVTVATIAKLIGMTPEYLITLFRERVGKSPYSYLIELRMRRASELLQTGASVKEAAISVGYASPNYFSRLFRRKMGVSPGRLSTKQNKRRADGRISHAPAP